MSPSNVQQPPEHPCPTGTVIGAPVNRAFISRERPLRGLQRDGAEMLGIEVRLNFANDSRLFRVNDHGIIDRWQVAFADKV
jgi:hypothetical protein